MPGSSGTSGPAGSGAGSADDEAAAGAAGAATGAAGAAGGAAGSAAGAAGAAAGAAGVAGGGAGAFEVGLTKVSEPCGADGADGSESLANPGGGWSGGTGSNCLFCLGCFRTGSTTLVSSDASLRRNRHGGATGGLLTGGLAFAGSPVAVAGGPGGGKSGISWSGTVASPPTVALPPTVASPPALASPSTLASPPWTTVEVAGANDKPSKRATKSVIIDPSGKCT